MDDIFGKNGAKLGANIVDDYYKDNYARFKQVFLYTFEYRYETDDNGDVIYYKEGNRIAYDTSKTAKENSEGELVRDTNGDVIYVYTDASGKERIAYDRYMAIMESGFSSSQQLLFPERLTLSAQEYDLLEESSVDLALLGFDIELKGDATIDVRGIPANIATDSIERTLFELLETLSLPVSSQQIRKEKMAQTLAKSEALHRITYTQSDAEAIVAQLHSSKEQYYTSAGKRIAFRIGVDEFEKRLGN
jgi:DNA mismatch repair ATPase MutL